MSRRILKQINTGVVTQRTSISPTPGFRSATAQSLQNQAPMAGSSTARNILPNQKKSLLLQYDQPQHQLNNIGVQQQQQTAASGGPRTIRSTKHGLKNVVGGNYDLQQNNRAVRGSRQDAGAKKGTGKGSGSV